MAFVSGCAFVVEKDWSQIQSLAGPVRGSHLIKLLPDTSLHV